jgi:hypothetical protein
MDVKTLEKNTLSRKICVEGRYRAQRGGGFHISRGLPLIEEIQRFGASSVVLGEFLVNVWGDGDSEFDGQRKQLGLDLVRNDESSRARLAFARFIVVKAFDALPVDIAVRRVGLISYADTYNICDDVTERTLLEEAVRLDGESTGGKPYALDGEDVLLVTDKIFVAAPARRCGVSEYIQSNLADITHIYVGARPKLVVLNCGDFSNEHLNMGITEGEYKEILRKHYTKAGYKSFTGMSPYMMWRLL